ncbi:methylated-DNA--[protein]-cysteine S-methyltransferase [Petrotoga sp. DB-2]
MKAVLGTPIGSVIIYVKNDKITKIKLTFQKEGRSARQENKDFPSLEGWAARQENKDFPSLEGRAAGRRGANKNENYYNSKTKKHFDIIYAYLFGDLHKIPKEIFDFPGETAFAKKVYETLYNTKKGSVITYKELASKAGNPKAYRTVGNLMKNNPLPIIIPCHRVIKSDGSIGKFSPNIKWKKYLLDLER